MPGAELTSSFAEENCKGANVNGEQAADRQQERLSPRRVRCGFMPFCCRGRSRKCGGRRVLLRKWSSGVSAGCAWGWQRWDEPILPLIAHTTSLGFMAGGEVYSLSGKVTTFCWVKPQQVCHQ